MEDEQRLSSVPSEAERNHGNKARVTNGNKQETRKGEPGRGISCVPLCYNNEKRDFMSFPVPLSLGSYIALAIDQRCTLGLTSGRIGRFRLTSDLYKVPYLHLSLHVS